MNEKYERYFYVLEHDATPSMARLTDPRFSYVIAFSDQSTANLLKSGDCRRVSEQAAFQGCVLLGVGHSKRDVRFRLTLADMKMLPQHWRM
jgi:hypothetical protein